VITTVFSDDNRKIAEFYKERRIVIPLSNIPQVMIDAFIATEDARFLKHKGIDFFSIGRAFLKNLEAGTIVQGGSTITQQVTKSFLLTPERSYSRKIKEAILAYRIDKSFTKEEILFLYLNQIYLGHGAYGVEAASENYFGKPVRELNLAECSVLAGLPQAPSRYSPFRYPEKAKQRQIYVLNRMVAEGYITNIQATEAINTKLDIKPRRNWFIQEAPFYTEHIRRYIEKKYGPDTLYKEGLKIYTAVNIDMQKTAQAEIEKNLKSLDKRQGYRGPLNHISIEEIEAFSQEIQNELDKDSVAEGKIVTGVVISIDNINNSATVRMGNTRGIIKIADMRWARKPDPEVPYYECRIEHPGDALKIGDIILSKIKGKPADSDIWELALEQKPDVQAALLCIENKTGLVKAMIGGLDFRKGF
jgi:penicillin-binding protein 1A